MIKRGGVPDDTQNEADIRVQFNRAGAARLDAMVQPSPSTAKSFCGPRFASRMLPTLPARYHAGASGAIWLNEPRRVIAFKPNSAQPGPDEALRNCSMA